MKQSTLHFFAPKGTTKLKMHTKKQAAVQSAARRNVAHSRLKTVGQPRRSDLEDAGRWAETTARLLARDEICPVNVHQETGCPDLEILRGFDKLVSKCCSVQMLTTNQPSKIWTSVRDVEA